MSFGNTLRADNGTRGGGHFRLCSSDVSNSLTGYYFFDYLQTRKEIGKENDDEHFFNKKSCVDRTKEIADKLILSVPELGYGLKQFIDGFGKTTVAKDGTKRTWNFCHTEYCLKDQAYLDPKDSENIPKNCKSRTQVAVRDDWDNKHIVINVDKTSFDAFEKNTPEQCSYFFIHEWLRDFVPTNTLAELNRYLHSTQFFSKDSPSEISKKFPSSLQKELSCLPERKGDAFTKIEQLEGIYLEAYFHLIKTQNNAKDENPHRIKMEAAFKACLEKSKGRNLPDYSTASICTNTYSRYIPFESCLKSIDNYDRKRRLAGQSTLARLCQFTSSKLTGDDCVLYVKYLDKLSPLPKQEKIGIIKNCQELAEAKSEFRERFDPYSDTALTLPIKNIDKGTFTEDIENKKITRIKNLRKKLIDYIKERKELNPSVYKDINFNSEINRIENEAALQFNN